MRLFHKLKLTLKFIIFKNMCKHSKIKQTWLGAICHHEKAYTENILLEKQCNFWFCPLIKKNQADIELMF